MSNPKMNFHVETLRLDAHGSLARCKDAEITLDTDLQGRADAFNPAELLLAAVSACIITTTHLLATAVVFLIALVFTMLGLGGGMLYVPVLKWLELPFKTVAIPLSLLLNGVTTLSAFLRYWREGLVDFRGGLPAAGRLDPTLTVLTLVAAIAGSQLGAWFMARRAKPAWVKLLLY